MDMDPDSLMNPSDPLNPVQLFLVLLMSGSKQMHMPARERKDYIRYAQTATTHKTSSSTKRCSSSCLLEVRSLKDMTQTKVCQVIKRKKKKICLSKLDISFPNQRKRDPTVRMGGILIVSWKKPRTLSVARPKARVSDLSCSPTPSAPPLHPVHCLISAFPDFSASGAERDVLSR